MRNSRRPSRRSPSRLIRAKAKGPTKALRAATPGLWRENLSDEEQLAVNEIMGETLERLGYEV